MNSPSEIKTCEYEVPILITYINRDGWEEGSTVWFVVTATSVKEAVRLALEDAKESKDEDEYVFFQPFRMNDIKVREVA